MECIDSLSSTDPIDLAVLALPNEQLEQSMHEVITNRGRSVTIFASCYRPGPRRSAAGGHGWQRLAREARIPVCGGNGMGFVNLDRQLRVTGFYQPPDLVAGGVTFLTHSGLSLLRHAPQPPEHPLQPGGLDRQRAGDPNGRLHRLLIALDDHYRDRTVSRDGPRHQRHVGGTVGGGLPGRPGRGPKGREDGPIAESGSHPFGGAGR